MSKNFLPTKGSCEQDVSMSPDVNTSWAPHPSCELGRDQSGSPTRGPKGPRRRDVERTRASRWRRGSRGMRPGKRPGHTHTRTSTHTHTHTRTWLRKVLGGPAAVPSAAPKGTREAGLQPECGKGSGAVGPPGDDGV